MAAALSPAPLARRRFYAFGTRAGVNRRPSWTLSVTKVGSIGWISLAGLCSVADREAVANGANNLSGRWAKSVPKFSGRERGGLGDVMPISAPFSWVMSPITPQRVRGRAAWCQSGHDGKGWVAFGRRIAIAYLSKRFGRYGASMLFSGVTRLSSGAALAQVWMDHICCRPVAASAFRLTLKDGAEPWLGAPGPE